MLIGMVFVSIPILVQVEHFLSRVAMMLVIVRNLGFVVYQ
jgi:hypothetical protein